MDHSDGAMKPAFAHMYTLGEREANCPSHGSFTAHGRQFGKRQIWTMCPGCDEEREAAQREEEQRRQAAARAKRREAAIGEACIPARFRGLSFENFDAATPAQLAVMTKVRDYAERFAEHRQRGAGLVLAGKPGTGKTHLASAVMLHLLDSQHWVQYTTCMGLIRMVRDTWRRDSERSEKEVLTLLGERIDLLVIDEVGVQYGTDGEQTVLFEILDRRYSEMRPTILLTNQDKAGFKSFVGERVADRLTQTHDWLAFDWPSYRKQARAA